MVRPMAEVFFSRTRQPSAGTQPLLAGNGMAVVVASNAIGATYLKFSGVHKKTDDCFNPLTNGSEAILLMVSGLYLLSSKVRGSFVSVVGLTNLPTSPNTSSLMSHR